MLFGCFSTSKTVSVITHINKLPLIAVCLVYRTPQTLYGMLRLDLLGCG